MPKEFKFFIVRVVVGTLRTGGGKDATSRLSHDGIGILEELWELTDGHWAVDPAACICVSQVSTVRHELFCWLLHLTWDE